MSISRKHVTAIARVCVALSYADGDIDSVELAAFELVGSDLGLSRTEVADEIAAAVKHVHSHRADVDAVIVAECGKLPKALHPSLFEAAAHMVLADGKLTDAECLRLAALRAFLGIPEAISLAVVAAVAHAEPTLKVQLTKAAAG